MARPVILDEDTGIDDALALMFTVKHPDLDVRAVTCVAGNAGIEQVVANTCAVLDLAGAQNIPVAAGAFRPLIERSREASWVHGCRGLGDLHLDRSRRRPAPLHAVELLRRELLASAIPVTIIALAPLTNLALLLRMYPEIAAHIERIIFMGGSTSVGNASPVAEYNIWHDPEAASMVLNSAVPLTMYGLDVYNRILVEPNVIHEFKSSPVPMESAVGKLLDFELASPDGTVVANPLIGDAGAVCAVVAPGLFDFETWPVQVELAQGLSRGQTVVDRRRRRGEDAEHGSADSRWAHAEIVMGCDPGRVLTLFVTTLCA